MKKIICLILFVAVLTTLPVSPAGATIPTFDAVNAALNELRNSILNTQFAQDIALAIERLEQLRLQYSELLRFNSGLDEFIEVFVGDPLDAVLGGIDGTVIDAFTDFGWITPEIEALEQAAGAADVRASLEAITGDIPNSEARPYIPFEEMQVLEGFRLAREIREAGEDVRDAAHSVSAQARSASPKGAERLQAEALSEVILLSQQNQEAMAKLIELEATQVEQVSREEKRLEWERLKYMEDAVGYLDSLLVTR